jgi:hypothetical protein
MENQEINKKIIETLAVLICNRPIVYENNSKFQTETVIMASHYGVGLHEICHWIGAIPSERGKYNLGLPIDSTAWGLSSKEMQDRMDKEEATALAMPILFYQKYMVDDERLKKMVVGMEELVGKIYFEPVDEVKARAKALFDEYTADLDRETLLYVAMD